MCILWHGEYSGIIKYIILTSSRLVVEDSETVSPRLERILARFDAVNRVIMAGGMKKRRSLYWKIIIIGIGKKLCSIIWSQVWSNCHVILYLTLSWFGANIREAIISNCRKWMKCCWKQGKTDGSMFVVINKVIISGDHTPQYSGHYRFGIKLCHLVFPF